MNLRQAFRRWVIARAIRRIIVPYRIGRAEGGKRTEEALGFFELSDEQVGDVFEELRARVGMMAPSERPPERKVRPLAPAKREAGRQRLDMPSDGMSIFAGPGWGGPIPREARSGPWEDHHTFPPGEKPKRDSVFGLHGADPISFVCMACELEQPPVTTRERRCPYCGLSIKLYGARLYWWRPDVPAVAPWEPKP